MFVDLDRPLGTRDLGTLRTLTALVFKWYINADTTGSANLSTSPTSASTPQSLLSGVSRLWDLIYPAQGPPSPSSSSSAPESSNHGASQVAIQQMIVSRHLSDLLRSSVSLVSLEQSSASHDEKEVLERIQGRVNALLRS